MTKYLRILAAVLSAALTVGPVSAATASSATPLVVGQAGAVGTVTGSLRDNSGAPITGAHITLVGPGRYATDSDAKGSFTISNVTPGIYRLDAIKAGYTSASEPDLAVVSGQTLTLAIVMDVASFESLRTIATVRAVAPGTFNTSTATVNVVNSQVFSDQGQPQVTRVLNQIPGVQISLPSSSGNGAVPGAITFPNIRGALSYETASLIDGHPLSVGEYGDYVTTFLNSFLLGGVEVVKGPGAMSPQTNYAIGGTINFRTKDPTLNPTPYYTFGVDNRGGSFTNFGFSDTVGRLGFVVDFAGIDEPSAVNGSQEYFYPLNSGAVCPPGSTGGSACRSLYSSGSADRATYVAGTASKLYNNFPLVACCYPVSGQYDSQGELVKFRYKLSDATVATVSYLGSQTTANQNGNTSSLTPSLFTPGATYTGTTMTPNQQFMMSSVYAGGPEIETNNEPIFQAEVRTTFHNDTILARWYNAAIQRIINSSNSSVDQPFVENAKMWGTGVDYTGATVSYNGETVPIFFYNFYNQNEIDNLTGYSLEYDHPIGTNNTLTLAWNNTNSTTTAGTLSSDDAYSSGAVKLNEPFWGSIIPQGSGQIFNTYLLRDQANIGTKLNATISLYENTYKSTYPVASPPPLVNPAGSVNAGYSYPAGPYNSGWVFNTHSTNHFDERVGFTYRPERNTAYRLSFGSAIAPPYIYLLSQLNGTIAPVTGQAQYLQTVNAGTLKPETAFGWDIGFDHRMKDGLTYVSADAYLTNLFNAFITQTYDSGIVCDDNYNSVCTNPGELYFKSNVNLNNERYEGIELNVKRVPQTGFGYSLAGGVQRGFAYNLPACFYSTTTTNCSAYNTNLAILADQNNSGNAVNSSSGILNGFSNQSIPYLNANAEISYSFANGAYLSFGATAYGKNNSYYEPPFTIGYLTARYPINDNVSIQISGDNIFNALSGLFPIQGGGVPISLAGVPAGSPAGTPALGATYGNVLGPATWRFVLTKTFGKASTDNGRARNSSR